MNKFYWLDSIPCPHCGKGVPVEDTRTLIGIESENWSFMFWGSKYARSADEWTTKLLSGGVIFDSNGKPANIGLIKIAMMEGIDKPNLAMMAINGEWGLLPAYAFWLDRNNNAFTNTDAAITFLEKLK